MFAVVDQRRPDLTTEAVLAGMADVFARPLGGRRVANAIEREIGYEAREAVPASSRISATTLYGHSQPMRDVMHAHRARRDDARRSPDSRRRRHRAPGRRPRDPRCASRIVGALSVGRLRARSTRTRARRGAVRTRRPPRGSERVRAGPRARQPHRAAVRRARSGTLYLQNVAEAPTRVQARLARLLRDREATLVGDRRDGSLSTFGRWPASIPVRHRVQEGRVREDLFRRLSVIRIEMPPLRNRREDIPALANYFLREICAGAARAAENVVAIGAVAVCRRCRGAATLRELRRCSNRSSPACRAGAASRSRTCWRTCASTAARSVFATAAR